MTSESIPDYEISWLLGLDAEFKKELNNGELVYPVNILPPKLRRFVKHQTQLTEFIDIDMLSYEINDVWSIWGWKTLPATSSSAQADWAATVKCENPSPTMHNLKTKVEKIQSELNELRVLLEQY